MDAYHRRMEVVIGPTLTGLPVISAPIGLGATGLPTGLQIVGPVQANLAVLRLAHAHEGLTRQVSRRPPVMLEVPEGIDQAAEQCCRIRRFLLHDLGLHLALSQRSVDGGGVVMSEGEEMGTARSAEQALAILDLLGQHQALGLEELHYLTELSKATVSWLLHTLLEQDWLYRGLTDRRYRLRSVCLYGDAVERFRCRVVERSAPLLVELSKRIELVADLLILDGSRPLVVESSVPGALRKHYPADRLVVGQYTSLSHSAMGRACLSKLADSGVRRLARQRQVDEDLWLRTREQAHGQGYGECTEGHQEYPMRLPFLTRTVVLPVRAQGRLLGSVVLHWPCDRDCVERVCRRYLGALADAVSRLQRALD